jgi:hypothetical protein
VKTIQEVIEEKQKEVSELNKEIDNLRILVKKYPDLKKHVDRWRNERLKSKKVNAIADLCYFAHSCGCCDDSPLFVWPYIKDEETGLDIYSDPPNIFIGEKNPYPVSGRVYKPERVNPNWEENLRECNISQVVIDKTREYLLKESNLEEDDWEDDWDDLDPLI